MTTIRLPEPALVVLIGAAGSGKSTFARRAFAPDEILSSDALRGLIAGDEADQGATNAAFGLLHRRLVQRLRAGLTTVVDATNAERHARRALLRRAAAAAVPAVAIVLDLPPAIVHRQNASRPGRRVDPAVVDRHSARVSAVVAGGTLKSEGFVAVVVVTSAEELAELVIERSTRDGPAA
jgi:protein phosphatase